MTRTTLLLGLIAGVVVIGGAYFVTHNPQASKQPGEAQVQSPAPETPGIFDGSIADLAIRGGDWKCTVDAKANTGGGQAISSGVVYVSGKRVRADFTSTVPGMGKVDSHLMADGTDVYSWTSLYPQGIKTKMAAADSDSTTKTSGGGMDANQNYTYQCAPAQSDASLFVVPAGVSFRTI